MGGEGGTESLFWAGKVLLGGEQHRFLRQSNAAWRGQLWGRPGDAAC